jgi:parallel beta-helix repeat protein
MESAAAFFSYVHTDDEYDGGQIRRLRDALQGEMRMQLGTEEFDIFIDRDDISWGQSWKRRIDDSLASVTLLIPVLTPAFFGSKECRRELERFLERERELGRDDLVLPIYYLNAPQLDDPHQRDQDPLALELAQRQRAEWREFRFEAFTSPVVRQRVSQLAERMRESLGRARQPQRDPDADSTASSSRAPAGQGEASDSAGKQASGHRNEPRILVVDQWGNGDHTTIGEAITNALPGMRIVVRPGLYEEGLTIDKPLEILGQGPVQDVIVRAKDSDAVLFTANIGRVSNLTLQQAGGGSFFAVDIAQGRLELEECDITSASLAVVGVHDGADPRVRRNVIHDSHQGGILVYTQGLGTFEENDISGNALSGIEVREDANPTFRRNRIHDGRETGIFVQMRGLGRFEDNEIYANANAGITVREGGNPTVRGNRINRNGYEAIWVDAGGRGTFEGNDLTDNTRGAWDIAEDCVDQVVRRDNQE